MITKAMIQEIKQLNVSKDPSLTQERMRALWKSMTDQMKTQLTDYGFTESSVTRSCSKGNISVKLAAALGIITGCDPYYLTAEVGENTVTVDENRIRQFIGEHGYEKVLNNGAAPEPKKRKYTRKTLDSAGTPETEPEAVPETAVIEEITITAPLASKSTITLQEFADMQMESLSETEKNSINEMPEEDLTALLSALQCQVKYSGKAKNLIGLIRLILIR